MIYDQSRQLPANGFTRTGYQFDGWNTKADGSGQSYKDKAYVTNLATSGVTTLYAQWKPLTDTRYTVYYAYEEFRDSRIPDGLRHKDVERQIPW